MSFTTTVYLASVENKARVPPSGCARRPSRARGMRPGHGRIATARSIETNHSVIRASATETVRDRLRVLDVDCGHSAGGAGRQRRAARPSQNTKSRRTGSRDAADSHPTDRAIMAAVALPTTAMRLLPSGPASAHSNTLVSSWGRTAADATVVNSSQKRGAIIHAGSNPAG